MEEQTLQLVLAKLGDFLSKELVEVKYDYNMSNQQHVEETYFDNLSKEEPVEVIHYGNMFVKNQFSLTLKVWQ